MQDDIKMRIRTSTDRKILIKFDNNSSFCYISKQL